MQKEKANILIVDDIFSNQLLLSAIVENAGHEYKVVSNGKKAIDELERNDYDIIFMDIEMPVMNGIETTKHIRSEFSQPKNKIPIIAMTAHNQYEFSDKTEGAGFDEIISKPYSLDKFKVLLKKYVPEKA